MNTLYTEKKEKSLFVQTGYKQTSEKKRRLKPRNTLNTPKRKKAKNTNSILLF